MTAVDVRRSVRAPFRTALGLVKRYVAEPAKGSALELHDNTNLWGAPPTAARSLAHAASSLAKYPADYAQPLASAAADYLGVSANMVTTGCGSNGVIDAALRALADPGARLAVCDPTFSMLSTWATLDGLTSIRVPLQSDWHADVDALLDARARITYIASPANPTGIAWRPAALERLVNEAAGFVIIDAAYAEFDREQLQLTTRLAARNDHVLVVHTMSKAWGLSGLRVGFGVGAPNLVSEIDKARGPFTVSGVAEHIAKLALRLDQAWMRQRADEAVANRARLVDALIGIGVRPLPSDANFLLIPIPDRIAAESLAAALERQQILVRLFRGLRGIGDAMRVTVGPWPQMQQFITGLRRSIDSLSEARENDR